MTTTTSGKKAGGFVIDRPGKYRCKDGSIVTLIPHNSLTYPWNDGTHRVWNKTGKRYDRSQSHTDIIAPVTPPRATKASRGGRYVARENADGRWAVSLVGGMSKREAGKLARALNADAGERETK